MRTWIVGPNSEADGYVDPINLGIDAIAFSPVSQEGDATAFLNAIQAGDSLRAEVDGSNYREGVVVSVTPGAHYEVYLEQVMNNGGFAEDDLLTVTHTPAGSSPAGSNIMLLGAA